MVGCVEEVAKTSMRWGEEVWDEGQSKGRLGGVLRMNYKKKIKE